MAEQLYRRLLDEVVARHPGFVAKPEPEARLRAAARLLGGLPEDYRAFLAEVGRVPWPMDVGNVLDFRAPNAPPGFVPFASDGLDAHGYLLPPAADEAREGGRAEAAAPDAVLAAIGEGGAAGALDDAAADDEAGALDDAAAGNEAGASAFERRAARQELGDLADAPGGARAGALTVVSVDLQTGDCDGDDDPDAAANSFRGWLEIAIQVALEEEQDDDLDGVDDLDDLDDDPAFAAGLARPEAEPDPTPVPPGVGRALDLLECLVARRQLELSTKFDENAAAAKLAPLLGDAEDVVDALVDIEGVEEVFASPDDVERYLEEID